MGAPELVGSDLPSTALLLPSYRLNLHLRLNSVKQVTTNSKKAEQFLHRMHIYFILGNTLEIVS